MKKYLLITLMLITSVTYISCKKNVDTYDTSDLYPVGGEKAAASSAVKVFYSNVAFYQLNVYRFDPDKNAWGKAIGSSFVTLPPNDSVTIGFTNTAVANSGTALLDMVSLYSAQIGSTNVKTAQINVPRFLQFFPITTGATRGTARIIKQDVVITRSNGTTFKIGISGEGPYDEATKVIDLVANFDETDIQGPGHKYTYKLSVNKLTL